MPRPDLRRQLNLPPRGLPFSGAPHVSLFALAPSAFLTPLWLILIASVLGGCGERKEVVEPCADCVFDVIEGRVIADARSLPAWVTAVTGAQGSQGTTSASALADAEGNYRLLVTPGVYRLGVRAGTNTSHEAQYVWRGGKLTFGSRADTVKFQPGATARRIDFELGSIRAVLATPVQYQTDVLIMRIYPIGLGGATATEALVRDASIEITSDPLPSGAYFVSFEWGDDTLWYPHEPERAGAAVVMVKAGEQTVLAVDLPRPGRLRGLVTGSWQSMTLLEPPTVTAYGADSTSGLRFTRVGFDGRYAFDVLASRELRLRVSMGGRQRWLGGESFKRATTYFVRPAEIVTASDYVESGLRIRVVQPPGSAYEGVSAICRVVHPDGRVVTVQSGSLRGMEHLEIPNLSVGAYCVYIRQPSPYSQDWVSEWYDGADNLSTATQIVIEREGEAREVVFHPTRGGRIPVLVRGADGRPLTAARIYLDNADHPGDRESDFRFVEPDSIIWMRGIPTGPWYVGTEANVGPPIWYPGTRVILEATPVEVVDGEDSQLVEWSIPR